MLGFLSFATSQTGRWVVGGTILLAIVYAWFLNNNRMLIKLERMRAEREARKTQDTIREENNERLEKAERARADFRATDADDFGGLSDAAVERLTRS